MEFQTARDIIHRHGAVTVTMDSGERYRIYLGDSDWSSQDHLIEYDCGDEKYFLDGDAIESVELPKSDRIT